MTQRPLLWISMVGALACENTAPHATWAPTGQTRPTPNGTATGEGSHGDDGAVTSDGSSGSPGLPVSPAAPVAPVSLSCGGPTANASSLFSSTDESVHELVTCGGLQASLAKRMGIIILLSNPEIFEKETYDKLHQWAGYLGGTDLAFTQRPDGGWEVLVPNAGDSWFTLDLFEPDTDTRILADPFELESYLVGVRFDSTFDFETARKNVTLRNDYVVTYQDVGPLGHLMGVTAHGPGSFTMSFSLWDVAMLLFSGDWPEEASAGRFEKLNRVDVESTMSFYDERDGAVVHYEAFGARAPLRDSVQGISLRVQSLEATSGGVTITGETTGLTYLDGAGLAGDLDYSITVEGSLRWRVNSDFGDGALYPESSWACP